MNALLRRLHNPRGRECACDADCWCRRNALGRAVKWWFPARYFGLHHKNTALAEWKRSQPDGIVENWKREQGDHERRSDPE
jgi:hypothetical protein